MNINQKILFTAAASLFMVCGSAVAETAIANGKLYLCNGSSIVAVKTGAQVEASKAIARFKKIRAKKQIVIESSPVGSKKRKKAQAAKKNASRGIKDSKSCAAGQLDSPLIGDWNLILENGNTPAENGYQSLTLSFTSTTFNSVFTADSLTCIWDGTYTSASDLSSIEVLTTTGIGGVVCEQAIGQQRSALVSISTDDNTLTLDYRPMGALQVYERVAQ